MTCSLPPDTVKSGYLFELININAWAILTPLHTPIGAILTAMIGSCSKIRLSWAVYRNSAISSNIFLSLKVNLSSVMQMRIKAIYKNKVLKPLKKLNLKEGEEVKIEISNAVRKTKGIIKVDRTLAKEIAESDELSILNE